MRMGVAIIDIILEVTRKGNLEFYFMKNVFSVYGILLNSFKCFSVNHFKYHHITH